MRAWTGWDTVRHQVAICGRVADANGTPVTGAQITIMAMPQAFKLRVESAASVAGCAWEDRDERYDRTVSLADGIYYFLDLPAGRYTLKGIDARSGTQDEKDTSVAWSQDGKVKMAVADFKLSMR